MASAIAALSGWPIEVVRDVLDANEHIVAAGDATDGVAIDLSLAPIDRAGLEASTLFVTDGHLQTNQIIGLELLSGEPPPGYNPNARKGGPPGAPPPKGPPRDRP